MGAVGLKRSSVFAIREESTAGTLVAPSSADHFLPLRAGFEMSYEAETLENEEILNDLGKGKSFKGDESVTGTHEAYAKNSGVVATAPDASLLYKSIMGTETIAANERDTVSGSTVNVVNLDSGEGAERPVGSAVLIKHASNEWEVRNVSAVNTDALTMSFSLNNAPGTGVLVGRPITYSPGSTFPTFSAWLYEGNGHAVQAAAGCTVNELSFEASANEFCNLSFSYEGTKYYFNPIEITASTDTIDWTDDAGTHQATITNGWYRDPIELATAVQTAMNANTSEVFTVSYSSSTGKYTITYASPATLSLLWNSGAGTAQTIGGKLGFSIAADDTGSLTYTSDNAIGAVSASYTPSFDSVDPIVFKDAELFIGSQSENVCVCPTSVSINISKETEKVLCACEETGVKEIITVGREVTLEAEIVLEKYEVSTFNHLLNNDSIQASLTVGPKSSGNWIAGKVVNFYLRNCTVSNRSIAGDNFIVANVSLTGFVTAGSGKDLYINFL